MLTADTLWLVLVAAHPFLPDETIQSASVGTAQEGYLVEGAALPADHPHIQQLRTQRARGLRFGTQTMVDALVTAASAVASRHPGATLGVGNLSAKAGGDIPWSVSHNSGRDADLAFYLLDTESRPTTRGDLVPLDDAGWGIDSEGVVRFDVERNWTLVQALLEDTRVVIQYLFIARPLRALLLAEAKRRRVPAAIQARARRVLVQPRGRPPHNDHLHLRLHCSDTDVAHGCVEAGAQRKGAVAHARVTKQAARRIKTWLAHTNVRWRTAAAQRLGLLRRRGDGAALANALEDSDHLVRQAAAQALIDVRANNRCRAIERAIGQEKDPDTAYVLATALTALDPQRASRALPPLLESSLRLGGGQTLREAVAALLADTMISGVTGHLLDLLVDPVEAVRLETARALSRLANLDLGVDPDRWMGWWRDAAKYPRERWVRDGFALEGYDIDDPERGNEELLRALGSELPYLSENARRVLAGRLGKSPGKTLMWSTTDALWYWRVQLLRSRKP